MNRAFKIYITCFTTIIFLADSKAQLIKMESNTKEIVCPIQPTMYGVFFEDINFAADGGLYPELIKNRSFEFEDPMLGWSQPSSDRHSLNKNSGFGTIVKSNESAANRNYLQIVINNDNNYKLVNQGFRGIGLHADAKYHLKASINNVDGKVLKVIFTLVNKNGDNLGSYSFTPQGKWKEYEGVLIAKSTEEKASLEITFEGNGKIEIDKLSLFPQENWGNRPNGLRKDLVKLLYDMKPGFLRFPGGCIVEGRTLAQRYQWKKTVGKVEERETLINRWNSEFAHKPTPDYYQSFGLGFYEYFQLSEDIGAEPLPILNCGMACQFNSGELVPLEQLDPYVQGALDLIEFANGDVTTAWGKLRKEMGHEKPFDLKYIGVGNEQWGEEYFKRYTVFEKAIKAKYPSINIVSSSGPFPDGEHFEFGTKELAHHHDEELIDEHYYKPPSWFRENADRYDNYDRKGAKIFAGEFAAQSVATVSPDNKNNWECALSEAAFMTGLERNADIVHMTSYAPLMAHSEAWQWTPDMIWFNNLTSYGTANYYVQKMYANFKGTHLLKVVSDNLPVKGQKEVYASIVKDEKTNELYVKLVNTSNVVKQIEMKLNESNFEEAGNGYLLTSSSLTDLNSFDEPMKISPKEFSFKINGNLLKENLPAWSFSIYKLKLK